MYKRQDKESATSIVASYCKANLKKQVTGAALDISLLPSTVSGEDGLEAVMGMEKQKQEEENSQIVQAVRSLKLTPAQLMAFLNDPKNSLTASGHTDPKPEAPEKEDTAHEAVSYTHLADVQPSV